MAALADCRKDASAWPPLRESRFLPRRATRLWWSGLGLLGLFGLVIAGAATFFLTACEVDCGDSGGRAVFALVVASTPLAAVGGALAWLAPGVGSPWGAPRALRRVLLVTVGLGLGLLAAALGLLAAAALAEALENLYGWLTGRGLGGPLNDPEYARELARNEGLFVGVLGLICAALAVSVALPVEPVLGGRPRPRLLRWMLLALGWLAVAALLLAVAGLVMSLGETRGTPRPTEIPLTAGLLALPAALAAGAFLAARELRRQASSGSGHSGLRTG